jgi:hypothetical protein
MTTKTRADLVAKALANLGAIGSGQTPSDEDASTVDDHVDDALAILSAKGIVSIDDDEAIPVELFGPLADWLAEDAAPDFGRPTSAAAKMNAESEIRKVVYARPTREPLTTEYF